MLTGTDNLIPVEQAREWILGQAGRVDRRRDVSLDVALGRVLAEARHAEVDVPAHDNSAMDGYAVRTADLCGEHPVLPVVQRIVAGRVGEPLAPGTAARIFTGAPVPDGADAVVIQEDTRFEDGRVTVLEKPAPGANIRLHGHDIARGSEVLPAGRVLLPQDLGLLASLGIDRVTVQEPLTAALVNTGDEVIAPGRPLQPGQIYDSNSYVLEGLLRTMGMVPLKTGIVADDPDGTRRALEEAASRADLVISTGGVSVGEEDHVRAAVESLGELSLWKLAIKPGKPFSFGHLAGVPFFGLPGNPVAVFVTFVVLVRPYMLKMLGAGNLDTPGFDLPADFDRDPPASRQEYIRVRLRSNDNGQLSLQAFPDQGSSILTSLSWADGLAVVPRRIRVEKGDLLRYIPFKGVL